MKEKCKYCECGDDNERIIEESFNSDKGRVLLWLCGSLVPDDKGGQELNVSLLDYSGDAFIDFSTTINYCPFCGRKLSTEVVEP